MATRSRELLDQAQTACQASLWVKFYDVSGSLTDR